MTGGGVVAVVPVRTLRGGKTRLAGELTVAAREALTRHMLRSVVGAARQSGSVDAVVVVSPDQGVLALAREFGPGVVALRQAPLPAGAVGTEAGLNAAIVEARQWATRHAASAMLVLFGDLPLLTADDVRNLVRRDAPVVLAPDRHGTGTNALLLRLGEPTGASAPVGLFRFAFGAGSYARHIEEADRLGLEVATTVTAGTAFDLDTPADWRRLVEDDWWAVAHGEATMEARSALAPACQPGLTDWHPVPTL